MHFWTIIFFFFSFQNTKKKTSVLFLYLQHIHCVFCFFPNYWWLYSVSSIVSNSEFVCGKVLHGCLHSLGLKIWLVYTVFGASKCSTCGSVVENKRVYLKRRQRKKEKKKEKKISSKLNYTNRNYLREKLSVMSTSVSFLPWYCWMQIRSDKIKNIHILSIVWHSWCFKDGSWIYFCVCSIIENTPNQRKKTDQNTHNQERIHQYTPNTNVYVLVLIGIYLYYMKIII